MSSIFEAVPIDAPSMLQPKAGEGGVDISANGALFDFLKIQNPIPSPVQIADAVANIPQDLSQYFGQFDYTPGKTGAEAAAEQGVSLQGQKLAPSTSPETPAVDPNAASPSISSAATPPEAPPNAARVGTPTTPTDNSNGIKLSDFKTPIKAAALGAGGAALGLGLSAGIAQVGNEVNNVGDAVGKALKPLTDPLGLTDNSGGSSNSNLGRLIVYAGIAVVGALVIYMVVKK